MGKLKSLVLKGTKIAEEISIIERSHPKLSASAFLKESMGIARTTKEALDRIEKLLSESPEQYLATAAFLRRGEVFVRESGCTRSPLEIRRIRWMSNPDCDAELSALRSNLFEIWSLAVRQSTQKHPEAFGDIQDWDSHTRHFHDLEDQFKRICADIEEGWQPTDLEFDKPDREGRVKGTFRISDGEVVIGEGCGERLIRWSLQNNGKAVLS